MKSRHHSPTAVASSSLSFRMSWHDLSGLGSQLLPTRRIALVSQATPHPCQVSTNAKDEAMTKDPSVKPRGMPRQKFGQHLLLILTIVKY
jgi:hypothetical protein